VLSTDDVRAASHPAVARLRAGVDALLTVNLAGLSDEDVLAVSRELEVERRRLASVDQAVVAQIDQRCLAFERGCKNTTTLLALMLRVDPSEAKGRVLAAENHADRVGISGEPLPPLFPAVAAAVAAGSISPTHARIVTDAVEALPADVQIARGAEIERSLVDNAQRFQPKDLRLIARRLNETYDQDGRCASDDDRERRRFLDMRQHADGTVSGRFHTDAVTGEALMVVIDAGSKPRPAQDGTADPRAARQRRHDALRDCLMTVLRSGSLPASGGVSTTIVLTMTLDQFTRAGCAGGQTSVATVGMPRGPTGDQADVSAGGRPRGAADDLVHSGHGALIGLEQVGVLLGDARILPVVLDSVRGISAYGSAHRFFTEGQRLAMAARDRGCSFPGCTVPPAWCEAHHVIEAAGGGPTSVNNGTLLCGAHHRDFGRLGYRCMMLGGIPHWIAPDWVDPQRTPHRNTAHDAGD
jgi:hypothetical protein